MTTPAGQQRDRWSQTYATRSDFLGTEPSVVGQAALARFQAAGAHDLLELGPGQGRDTISFAAAGLDVTALDFAEPGLAEIGHKAARAGVAGLVRNVVGDVRDPLPFADTTFDACYAHMLLCMALTTDEIVRLTDDVRRVLRPGGLLVYTVRTTADAHYRAGVDHGDDRWEMGGFVVHFFDRALVDGLAAGWELLEVDDHEEGRLPRRLFVVTMRRP
jgi:SAM-dependent methyltransferase